MATPTLVQATQVSDSGSSTNASVSFWMPQPTLANNLIVVAFQFAAGTGVTSVAVTDDKSQTYTPALTQPGSGNGNQIVQISYFPGTAAGAQKITLTFSGASPGFVSFCGMEWYNVATTSPLSGTPAGNTGSSTSITSGSITIANAGDLVIMMAELDTVTAPATSFTAGSNFNLVSADVMQDSPMAVEYSIAASSGALNPSMTCNPTSGWAAVGIAFTSAASGTAPSGMYVQHSYHARFLNGVGSNPQTVQFPSSGNLLVCSWLGGVSEDITAITDSKSNSWGTAGGSGGGIVGGGSGGDAQIWYAGNASTATNLTVTLTRNAHADADTCILYDVVGAATSPFDLRGTNTGTQGGTGSLATASVTPTTSNGLIFWNFGVASNTCPGVSPGTFDSVICPTPITNYDENNGWGHYQNPNTSSVTFTASADQQGAGYGTWCSIAAAFKAPSSAGQAPGEPIAWYQYPTAGPSHAI